MSPDYLLVCLPPLLLLAAAGVIQLPRRGAAVSAAVLLVALSCWRLAAWYAQPGQEDNRDATRYIVSHALPGDGLLVFPDTVAAPEADSLEYYLRRDGASGPALVALGGLESHHPRPGRLWLVLRESEVLEEPAQARALEARVSRDYTRMGAARRFIGTSVLLYRLRGT